ncbi:MAG: DUF2232 domain-containing protein [Candidatus Krumholzibacteriia bacterium]
MPRNLALVAAVVVTVATAAVGWWSAAASEDAPVQVVAYLLLLPAPFVVGAVWGLALRRAGTLGQVATAAALTGAAVYLIAGGDIALPVVGHAAAGLLAALGLLRAWPANRIVGAVALALAPAVVAVALEQPVADVLALESDRARSAAAERLPSQMTAAEREAALREYDERMADVVAMAGRIWPGVLALGLLAVAAGIVAVTAAALRWLGGWGGGLPWSRFARWRLPFYLVWVLAAGLVMILTRQGVVFVAGVNAILVTAALLAVQGIAVQVHVIGRMVGPRGQVVFWIAAGLFFAPLVVASGALLGLLDQWLDIRRLDAGGEPPPGAAA